MLDRRFLQKSQWVQIYLMELHFFLVLFFFNWARNSDITDVAVVMALIVMSGSTEEIFLIGTATVFFFPHI